MHLQHNPSKGILQQSALSGRSPIQKGCVNIAMEMKLSETAFVFPGPDHRMIRFYTPEAEIKLCGHATLCASHILYETGLVKSNEEIIFSSKAGELLIKKQAGKILILTRYQNVKVFLKFR